MKENVQVLTCQRRKLLLFKDLNIITGIQKALSDEGYENPTPIQAKAIEPLLNGKDLLGCAQTGTGKTAAYAIPILQGINNQPTTNRLVKALVLAPTRELAIQIDTSFKTYGKYLSLRSVAIYGGVAQGNQTRALAKKVDILVATPGRLLDLINQKYISLKDIQYFVLDEADQMLDMGMIYDVKKIIAFLPKERQTMFFSATMPDSIDKLADKILHDPIRVAVTPVSSTVEAIKQQLYYVNKKQKINLLIDLLRDKKIESALVFSRTKHGADKIVKALNAAGYNSAAIHGNKSQNARQLALNSFKDKKIRILVATDIAARGIDIDELSHVIIYDLPEVPEIYVHRIGRTGRAGLNGIAISFCDQDETALLKDIQKLIKQNIPVVEGHPYPITDAPTPPKAKGRSSQRSSGQATRSSSQSQRSSSQSQRPTSQHVSNRSKNTTSADLGINTFAGSRVTADRFQNDTVKHPYEKSGSHNDRYKKDKWRKNDDNKVYRNAKEF